MKSIFRADNRDYTMRKAGGVGLFLYSSGGRSRAWRASAGRAAILSMTSGRVSFGSASWATTKRTALRSAAITCGALPLRTRLASAAREAEGQNQLRAVVAAEAGDRAEGALAHKEAQGDEAEDGTRGYRRPWRLRGSGTEAKASTRVRGDMRAFVPTELVLPRFSLFSNSAQDQTRNSPARRIAC